jgi:hypothetical protein
MCVEHQPEGQGKDANRADEVSYKSHVIILVLPPPRVHRPDFARQGIAPSGGYGLGGVQDALVAIRVCTKKPMLL